MRSRLFSALSGHPDLEVNRQPQYIEHVEGMDGGGITIAGFLRLLHDLPLEEIDRPLVRDLAANIRQQVAREMTSLQAMGEEPDVQDVINDVCDLSGCLAAVDAACGIGTAPTTDLHEIIRASLARRAAS